MFRKCIEFSKAPRLADYYTVLPTIVLNSYTTVPTAKLLHNVSRPLSVVKRSPDADV